MLTLSRLTPRIKDIETQNLASSTSYTNSNLHTHKWRDCRGLPINGFYIVFQSTRPWGARLTWSTHRSSSAPSFNPRARGGRDVSLPRNTIYPNLFQSTRPWGARLCRPYETLPTHLVSIHAPVGGATCSWGHR